MQRAIFCGNGQRIIRQCKMVNADWLITETNKALGHCACLRKALIRIRQATFVNQSLVRATLRQMCIPKAS